MLVAYLLFGVCCVVLLCVISVVRLISVFFWRFGIFDERFCLFSWFCLENLSAFRILFLMWWLRVSRLSFYLVSSMFVFETSLSCFFFGKRFFCYFQLLCRWWGVSCYGCIRVKGYYIPLLLCLLNYSTLSFIPVADTLKHPYWITIRLWWMY